MSHDARWVRWRPQWHISEDPTEVPVVGLCGKPIPTWAVEVEAEGPNGVFDRDDRWPDVCPTCVQIRDQRGIRPYARSGSS